MKLEIFSRIPPLKKEWELNDFRLIWKALQEEPSSLYEPVNIMQIQIHDHRDANFLVKIAIIDVIFLYDTGVNMNCIPFVCYPKLKDPPSLKTMPAMLVHSATCHDLCPVGLTCEITIGKSQFKHTFIVCKKLHK